MIKGGAHYEELSQNLAVLRPGDRVRALPGLDYAVNTRRKRHITGGLLISAALLFGGLAITVMSVRDEEDDYNE